MTNRQQRRIVYFLGAGASLGAGATATIQGGGVTPIPTQETFWETFLRFCQSKNNRKDIESFLFRYFLGYSKAPGKLKASKRRRLLKPIDVEEVFTFLSERTHAPRTSPQFQAYTKKIWDALVTEIGEVFSRFEPNGTTKRVFRAFERNHVRAHDTIVSFNYDIVFERSLARLWYYECIDLHHRPRSRRILKPHGSINWNEDKGKISSYGVNDGYPEVPVVVAPTHLKFIGRGEAPEERDADSNEVHTNGVNDGPIREIGYLNQSRQIADVWGAMEGAMRAARSFVFIGYSFPPSDLYFSSVLRSVLATRDEQPQIVIVNPDAMAIRSRLSSRFSIPAGRIRTFQDIQSFNQVNRKQIRKLFETTTR